MPKINREEYEILKELGDRWEWIAKDADGRIYVYEGDKPEKIGINGK